MKVRISGNDLYITASRYEVTLLINSLSGQLMHGRVVLQPIENEQPDGSTAKGGMYIMCKEPQENVDGA